MGRKRKAGPRTPSGQKSRAQAARVTDEIIPPYALIRRAERSMCLMTTCEAIIKPATESDRAFARIVLDAGRDQNAGHALGALYRQSVLTEVERDAGIRAGHIWRRWRSMTGCPSPHARVGSAYGPQGGGERPVTAEAWGVARAEYEALCAALRPHGEAVAVLVETVCADDVLPERLDTWRDGLRRALAALAREWRIGA